MGIAAYGLDGSKRFHLLAGKPTGVVLTFRGRAYLSDGSYNRLKVVDLGKGTLLKDRRTPIAQLLIGDGSR
jgi:hypothetical protein